MFREVQECRKISENVEVNLFDLENIRCYYDDKYDIEDGISQLYFIRYRKSYYV